MGRILPFYCINKPSCILLIVCLWFSLGGRASGHVRYKNKTIPVFRIFFVGDVYTWCEWRTILPCSQTCGEGGVQISERVCSCSKKGAWETFKKILKLAKDDCPKDKKEQKRDPCNTDIPCPDGEYSGNVTGIIGGVVGAFVGIVVIVWCGVGCVRYQQRRQMERLSAAYCHTWPSHNASSRAAQVLYHLGLENTAHRREPVDAPPVDTPPNYFEVIRSNGNNENAEGKPHVSEEDKNALPPSYAEALALHLYVGDAVTLEQSATTSVDSGECSDRPGTSGDLPVVDCAVDGSMEHEEEEDVDVAQASHTENAATDADVAEEVSVLRSNEELYFI